MMIRKYQFRSPFLQRLPQYFRSTYIDKRVKDKRNKAFFLKSHNSTFQFGENESSGKKSEVKTLIHAAAIQQILKQTRGKWIDPCKAMKENVWTSARHATNICLCRVLHRINAMWKSALWCPYYTQWQLKEPAMNEFSNVYFNNIKLDHEFCQITHGSKVTSCQRLCFRP